MSLSTDLDSLIEKETNLTSAQGKMAKFAYTDQAYADDDYQGVEEYDAGDEQNIPLASATVLKVNPTVLTEGFRAQASSIGRMVVNHFFGRASYNLNKIHDNFLTFVTSLKDALGTANGIATLRSGESRLTISQSPYGTDIPVSNTDNRDVVSYMKKLFTLPFLGRDWTQSSQATTNTYSLYYADGIWVAGSEGLWWSTDGRNWTHSAQATTISFQKVYYANGIWVAGSFGSGLWWSTDGKNWTQGSGATSYSIQTVYYANGIWVAGAYVHGLWWSTDGKTWTQSSQATTNTFSTVYYANGIWVAGSSSQGLWWSTDGKTWTQSSQATTNTFSTVYYANGIWVAGTYVHGLWWSTDGKTWTQSSQATTNVFRTVYYANGIWVAGSSNHGLWWSSIDNLVGFPFLDS